MRDDLWLREASGISELLSLVLSHEFSRHKQVTHLYSHVRGAEDDLAVSGHQQQLKGKQPVPFSLLCSSSCPGAACKAALASHGTYLPPSCHSLQLDLRGLTFQVIWQWPNNLLLFVNRWRGSRISAISFIWNRLKITQNMGLERWLRAGTAFVGDQSSMPSTHTGWFTSCNFTPKGSSARFWPL